MAAFEIITDFLRGRHTWGQMLNLARYALGKKRPIVTWQPIDLSVFLTYRCNLNCDMCLTHSTRFNDPWGQKSTSDISYEQFTTLLRHYRNALTVNLIGNGEPLLHRDFFKMVDFASRAMKMNVNSSSNGIILGDYADEVVRAPIKHFNVSVNGHTREEFHRMTGMPPQVFDTIRDNTASLVAAKKRWHSSINIAATFILDKVNIRMMRDIIDFADGLGVDEIAFFQFLPSPVDGFRPEERCLFADEEEVRIVLDQVQSLPASLRQKVTLPVLLDRSIRDNKVCTVWMYNISVDGDLNAGGCCCQLLDLEPGGKFGNTDPWNNEYFQTMRRRFLDPGMPLLEPCTWCYNNSSHIRDWATSGNPVTRLFRRLTRLQQK